MVKIIGQIQLYDRNMYTFEEDVERKLMENSRFESDISSSESLGIVPANQIDIHNSDVPNAIVSKVMDSTDISDENNPSVTA